MKEKKCYESLGLDWKGNPDSDVTLKNLTYAIERSIESRLVGSLSEVSEFTPVRMLDDDSLLLLKHGNDLMCLKSRCDYENLETETYGQSLFHALDNDGMLHEVLPQPIVDEFNRLVDIMMADRIDRARKTTMLIHRKRNLAELERLTQMRDDGLI